VINIEFIRDIQLTLSYNSSILSEINGLYVCINILMIYIRRKQRTIVYEGDEEKHMKAKKIEQCYI